MDLASVAGFNVNVATGPGRASGSDIFTGPHSSYNYQQLLLLDMLNHLFKQIQTQQTLPCWQHYLAYILQPDPQLEAISIL